MKLRLRNSPNSTKLKSFQQAARISNETSNLKIRAVSEMLETDLGARGRAFKSPRPDQ